MIYTLPETELMKIQTKSEDDRSGVYVIEPLSPGYGVTLGNSLRRVLFSSLAGSAVSSVQIEGATHEFTTIAGMHEDVVELILNLKTLRVKLHSDEPVTLKLEAKGAGEVRAKDFAGNSLVTIVDEDHYLATLDKAGKLSLEVTIERGRGYIPTEQKRHEQRALGVISVDSIFTPVKKVHYEVENTRVGDKTNFDKLTLDITTDGTIHPREALRQAAQILVEHMGVITEIEASTEAAPKKSRAKKATQSETSELAEAKPAKEKKAAQAPTAEKAPVKKSKKA
jgi:DNA-directed RNA polymerase subunit alpha